MAQNKNQQIMYGADPEFFLYKQGELISGAEAFPNPIETDSGYIFNDGIVCEVNPIPSDSTIGLLRNLDNLFNIVRTYGFELKFEPIVETNKFILERAAQFDRSILTFGCSPDINIYQEELHSYRGDASNIFYRFAGGHIHIGVEGECEGKIELLKNVEARTGLAINSFANKEGEKQRRNFYGRAGACRLKSYGIEWRTPSAAIFNINNSINYQQTTKLLEMLDLQIKNKISPLDLSNEEVQKIINNGDVIEEAWNY